MSRKQTKKAIIIALCSIFNPLTTCLFLFPFIIKMANNDWFSAIIFCILYICIALFSFLFTVLAYSVYEVDKEQRKEDEEKIKSTQKIEDK